MKTSALALTLLVASAHGFSTPAQHAFAARTHRSTMPNVRHHMSSNAQDEVDALRAAAAKAREEADKLAMELGKTIEAAPKKIEKKSLSTDELTQLTSKIDFEKGDAMSQTQQLDSLVQDGSLSLWKTANLRTFPVSLNFLEQRSGGKLTADALGVGEELDVNLDDFKYATIWVTLGSSALGIASLALLPENTGAMFCYGFALIPILWLGIGSTAPGIIAGAIQASRGTSDSEAERLDRICRHEAGHFVCGYLCGLPIKGYSLLDENIPCVEFHPSSEGGVTRELTMEEVSALSVVAMSGSVAEALALGSAKGGESDLIELDGLLRRSQEFIGAAKQQDLTRWGALTAYQLLNENQSKYEAIVEAFQAKKSVAECVAILESS